MTNGKFNSAYQLCLDGVEEEHGLSMMHDGGFLLLAYVIYAIDTCLTDAARQTVRDAALRALRSGDDSPLRSAASDVAACMLPPVRPREEPDTQ